jgi:flagellar M-ring protein FliF
MSWSTYWGALSSRQRIGLAGGAGAIAIGIIAAAAWLLSDEYVTLASHVPADRMEELTGQLDRARLHYRVGAQADAIVVPASELGQARAALAAGGNGDVPPNVGLEIFKEADFSSTDFSQRINYQRALQGELTRTIQTMTGVRSARVHVVLPEAGLFKRPGAKPSAAVTLVLRPGSSLSQSQVRGIQRLVVASVPEIKVEDVVLLDDSGRALTRRAMGSEDDGSSSQLDMKRQVDQYLEGKLQRLLQELAPQAAASLSVDALLDERQLRVTTEEPLSAPAAKNAEHATGVVVKERQTQRSRPAAGSSSGAGAAGTSDTGDADSGEWEYEYKVGQRVEQVLSAPGSMKRLTVAVALQGAPEQLSAGAVEQLVAHAVGVDRARGDSVAVVLLPRSQIAAMDDVRATDVIGSAPHARPMAKDETPISAAPLATWPWAWIGASLLLVCALVGWSAWRRSTMPESDIETATAQVQQWLAEDGRNDSR